MVRVDPRPDVVPAYVALCLRLRRLRPDLVDPVSVDPVVARAVAAAPTPSAAEIVREAGRLREALPDAGLAPGRARGLHAQLRAVEWRARRLAGQGVPFAAEVRDCLDLDRDPEPGDPDRYRDAHRALAALLPGSGPLAERMAVHRRRDAVGGDRLGGAARALAAALRGRVAGAYGLTAGEPADSVEFRLVDDPPWSALHTYCGAHRSVVRLDCRGGPGGGRLPRLVAHETYPGHHVECCRVEDAVAGGRAELGVTVLGTPQTVVSEGLAGCALDVAVGAGWGPWSEAVLADAGLAVDGVLAERLDGVLAVLRRVRLDAALLLHGAGPPTAGRAAAAQAHLQRWLLLDEARARRVVDALARPLWRTQVVAAVEGVDLVRTWLAGAADPVAAHRDLLDAGSPPSALRVRTGTHRGS